MSNRFSYVRYDDYHAALQLSFKEKFEDLEKHIVNLPAGRAKALVFTKIEEAYMWVGKAIRDNQIALTGEVNEQPERNNE